VASTRKINEVDGTSVAVWKEVMGIYSDLLLFMHCNQNLSRSEEKKG
jgi:hypothetical protein